MHTLFTDVNHSAYSGVLTQAVESPDDLRSITYMSGSFSDMQQEWSTTGKEAFAAYLSVLKLDLYVRGQNLHYTVVTNC